MNGWPSSPARRVLAALIRNGWHVKQWLHVKRQRGSHRVLAREGWPGFVFAFHDRDEIGPTMLARIGRRTGLTPDDL